MVHIIEELPRANVQGPNVMVSAIVVGAVTGFAFLVVLLATCIYLLVGASGQEVFLLALARFVKWIIYGFVALLIIEAIFSWVNPHAPLAPFVHALNDPLLRPIRRVVPPVGGLDLSVLVAVLLLQIALYVLRMLIPGPY